VVVNKEGEGIARGIEKHKEIYTSSVQSPVSKSKIKNQCTLVILYTYIRITYHKLFSAILLTCKLFTSFTNYQLSNHS
jgi:hypothetical protein